jgi:hypothetical protein
VVLGDSQTDYRASNQPAAAGYCYAHRCSRSSQRVDSTSAQPTGTDRARLWG